MASETRRGFLKLVFIIVTVVITYVMGAMLVVEYFPH
jgi:hypothetical protein